mgnify:CR=1 FL=1
MKKQILRETLRIAYSNLSKHPQLQCYPHSSFIVQHNQIKEWDTKHTYEPPVHYGYHKRIDNGRPKFHAEIATYIKARGLLNGEPFSCINIRLNKSGELKISAPCNCCYAILTALGCGEFWYTSMNGWKRI